MARLSAINKPFFGYAALFIIPFAGVLWYKLAARPDVQQLVLPGHAESAASVMPAVRGSTAATPASAEPMAAAATSPQAVAASTAFPAAPPGVAPTAVMRTQIVRANGKLQGFRLYPGNEQQRFKAMGLESGDIVIAVNGVSAATGIDLMQVLRQQRRTMVTILRGSQQQDLVLDLDAR